MLRFPKANRTILDKGHAVGLPGLRRSTGVLWLQSPLSSFHVNANGRGFPSLRFDHSQGTVVARSAAKNARGGSVSRGKWALMLAATRLRHVAGTKLGMRRYLDMNRLSEASEAG